MCVWFVYICAAWVYMHVHTDIQTVYMYTSVNVYIERTDSIYSFPS